MQDKTQILVVGAGFAAMAALRSLAGRLPPHCELTVMSEESYTTFCPMLPEAVGASVFPEHVVAPVREVLRGQSGVRFIMARVEQIDRERRLVRCHSLAGPLALPYDQLVLACGNRARLDILPGAADHALPLKTVGDAMHIRNTALRRLAMMELEADPAVRQRLGHVVVLGGGFSGVETAGELADCLASALRFYPRVRAEEIRLTLVTDADRLLLELPPALGEAARRSLAQRGVSIRFGLRAQSIDAEGADFGGERLTSSTVICTIGSRPNSLLEQLGLPLERGRLVVGADLAVAGDAHLWAMGDCALVPNAADGNAAPPTAQFAVREGQLLAANLLARLAGRPTAAFNYRSRGMMAAIGHRRGVAQVGPLLMSGLPAWLLWRAYYLSQMPTLRRKLRIFLEWTWGMFFAVDITHLRFTRSADQE